MLALAALPLACAGRAGNSAAPGPSANTACALSPTDGLRTVSLGSRTYHLYVPRRIGSEVPLLVSLHGTGANGTIQAAATHWTGLADSENFIAAFPDGLNTLWLWGVEKSYDVDFVYQVIADIRTSGCVDPNRVYIDGWSEGSYMAQRMACSAAQLGVRIAAIHGYAGGNPGDATCRPTQATRVLLSQGLDDRLIDPQKVGYPAFVAWTRRYSCAQPAGSFDAPQHPGRCVGGADAAWWPIAGQGHLDWSCAADPLWHDRGVWSFFTLSEVPSDTSCP